MPFRKLLFYQYFIQLIYIIPHKTRHNEFHRGHYDYNFLSRDAGVFDRTRVSRDGKLVRDIQDSGDGEREDGAEDESPRRPAQDRDRSR